MKIVGVQGYEVVVPVRPGAVDSADWTVSAQAKPWSEWPIVLVELRFSDGLTGLGEVGRGRSLKEIEADLRALVGYEPRGLDLSALPRGRPQPSRLGLEKHMPDPTWVTTSPIAGAVEMALLDGAGKRLGCRAVDLLGGAVRQRVTVDYWCGRQTPSDLAKTVEQAARRGFTGLKMKARLGDPTLEQVKVVKATGGAEFGLTIDPMHQWHCPAYVLPLLRALEPYARSLKLEDPVPKEHPSQWLRLQQASVIPLVWHARGSADMVRALEGRCADGFNCSGGIQEFLQQAQLCAFLGLPCWQGSSLELGVAQAARLHAAAASPACVWPSDLQGALVREHTLTTWSWPYENGSLPLPDGLGLGVELDRQALRHFARAEADFR